MRARRKRLTFILDSAYSRFKTTAAPSGVIAVAVQTFILFLAFGLSGALFFILIPILGTLASIVRLRHTSYVGGSESPRAWRNAAANAGIATIASIASLAGVTEHLHGLLALIVVASLTTALSDTLSHEIGATFGGITRRITTLRRVEPGTNGAVSVIGSASAIITAFTLPLIATRLGLISSSGVLGSALSAMAGNVVDSVLGATIEGHAGIDNNVVNFASVVSASLLVIFLVH